MFQRFKWWVLYTLFKKEMNAIFSAISTQRQSGNWNCSPYMQGLANGMILIDHILRNVKGCPDYLNAPEEWLNETKKFNANLQ